MMMMMIQGMKQGLLSSFTQTINHRSIHTTHAEDVEVYVTVTENTKYSTIASSTPLLATAPNAKMTYKGLIFLDSVDARFTLFNGHIVVAAVAAPQFVVKQP